MTTSGSTDFNQTRNEIIIDALEDIGVYAPGETPSAEDIDTAARVLNKMVKGWQAKNIGIWLNQDAVLFLQKATESYDIGLTGDHCTLSHVQTTLDGDVSSGALTIEAASISGISSGDYIGVELDTGYLHWTTVNGAPAGTTVTLTAAVTSDCNDGGYVYTYTSKVENPIDVRDFTIKLSGGTEIPIDGISRADFKRIPNKSTTGKCNTIYFDSQMTNGKLFVWPTADSVRDTLRFTIKRPIYDFDAIGDTPDFQSEWLECIQYNLAVRLAPKYGIPLAKIADLMALADASLEELIAYDEEAAGLSIKCG